MRFLRAEIDKYALDRWIMVVERERTHIAEVRGQHLSNGKVEP
jgi:hypothetical protein